MHINKLQLLFIALLIPVGALYWYSERAGFDIRDVFVTEPNVMHFDNIPVRVEIANSDKERIQGLSGRSEMGNTMNGLLFVFPTTDYHSMWMKDMKFPIDIIWISDDLKVINIEKNISPDTYPRTFVPTAPARYALETNVHYADALDLHAGMKVTLPKRYLDD